MMHIKGQKTPTEGAEVEGESRNLGAKSKYPKPAPPGFWLLATDYWIPSFAVRPFPPRHPCAR